MYPYSSLPKPLSTKIFYILLALSRSTLHPYAIKAAMRNDSLGAVNIDAGSIYRLIQELHDSGWIDLISVSPAGTKPAGHKHYAISELGTIRLKEEIVRLTHALKIAENAGLTETGIPLDIQKLLLSS